MDEGLKVKYRVLGNKLYNIKDMLNNLNDKYNSLNMAMKETIMIDDKIVNQDIFNTLNSNNLDIINEINNVIIPGINNKL